MSLTRRIGVFHSIILAALTIGNPLTAPAQESGGAVAIEPSMLICGADDAALAALLKDLRGDASRRVEVDVYTGPGGSTELKLARAVILAEWIEDQLATGGLRRERFRIHIRHEPTVAQPFEDEASRTGDETLQVSAEPDTATATAPAAECREAWAEARLPSP